MSSNKNHLINKKAAVGAALIALSGFVPQPLMQAANAATTNINVSGSFITGFGLNPGQNVNFGKILGTLPTGNFQLKETGAITGSAGAKQVGALQVAGSIKATIANKTAAINVTAKGLGPVVLAATIGGAGPTNAPTLTKLILGGAALTGQKIITAGGTTGKTTIQATTTAAAAIISVGSRVEWTGGTPLGAFASTINLTMAF